MKFEFPFERAARQGIVPDGLSLLDAGACYRLGEIYREYKADAQRSDPDARKKVATAKEKLRQEWTYQSKLALHWGELVNSTDYWRMEVRKNPTPENVTRLLDTMDGMGGRKNA